MKKVVKVLCLLAVALCVGFSLAACGENAVGVYEYSVEGVTTTLELKDDDTFTMSMVRDDKTTPLGTGTYKVDGDKITLTVGANAVTGTLKDGKITIAMEGEGSTEITYTKK